MEPLDCLRMVLSVLLKLGNVVCLLSPQVWTTVGPLGESICCSCSYDSLAFLARDLIIF